MAKVNLKQSAKRLCSFVVMAGIIGAVGMGFNGCGTSDDETESAKRGWKLETHSTPNGYRADIWFLSSDKPYSYITLSLDGSVFSNINSQELSSADIANDKHIVCETSDSYGGAIRCGWLEYNELWKWFGDFNSAALVSLVGTDYRLKLTIWTEDSNQKTYTIGIDKNNLEMY